MKCWKCKQPMTWDESDGISYDSEPPCYAHAKCPEAVNCTECGLPIGSPDYKFGLWSGTYGLRTDKGWKHFKCPEPAQPYETNDIWNIMADPLPSPKASTITNLTLGNISAREEPMNKEPELSLLVIDLGDSCVVKLEKPTPIGIGGFRLHEWFTNPHDVNRQGSNTAYIFEGESVLVRHTLDELRAALDSQEAEPPVPRLERGTEDETKHYFFLYDNGLTDAPSNMYAESEYLALCQLAGVTLPIYEPTKGTWTQVVRSGKSNSLGIPRKIDFEAWRYTR